MKIKNYCSILLLFITPLFNDYVKGEYRNKAHDVVESKQLLLGLSRKTAINPKYKFIKESLNVFHDEKSSLDSIYEILYQLKVNPDSVKRPLSVVHIGDSHIQAGCLTGVVMRNLQNEFGNAGRGLVVPLRLAKTNAPRDYMISSSSQWQGGRLIQRKNTLQIGVGGIALAAENEKVDFVLRLNEREQDDYSFNRITVFSDKDAPALSVNKQIFSLFDPLKEYPFAYRLELSEMADSIKLNACGAIPGKSTYYGFSLENGKPGVLYHSIGINGAHYLDYQNETLMRQTQALQPDLIVLSLGTNEAFGRNFTRAEFKKQISGMINLLKQANPNSILLLTTPAECYVRRRINNKTVYAVNTKIERVRDALIDYAKENGIAYWDLFEITGGAGSSKNWFNSKLMSRDRIHFTEEGYQLQGVMLFNAFITEYNEYLINRSRPQ